MTPQGQLVVVGVDGSAESAGALKWTADYCAATGARGRAILAWHYPAAVGPALVGVAPAAITDDVRQQVAQTLATAVAEAAPGASIEQRIGVLEELLGERYSCRAFLPDQVPRPTIDRILTAAQRTA